MRTSSLRRSRRSASMNFGSSPCPAASATQVPSACRAQVEPPEPLAGDEAGSRIADSSTKSLAAKTPGSAHGGGGTNRDAARLAPAGDHSAGSCGCRCSWLSGLQGAPTGLVDRPAQRAARRRLLGGGVGAEFLRPPTGALAFMAAAACMRLRTALSTDREKVRRDRLPHRRGQRRIVHQPAAVAGRGGRPRRRTRRIGARRILRAICDAPSGSTYLRMAQRARLRLPDPSRRLLQQRHADLDGIAQAQHPWRFRKRLGDEVAEQRVPARQLQDLGLAGVARKGGAQRTKRGDDLRSRPLVRRQQDFVDRHRLGVDDERRRAA